MNLYSEVFDILYCVFIMSKKEKKNIKNVWCVFHLNTLATYFSPEDISHLNYFH